VEEAHEVIIADYERVNHIISFNQDDQARNRGLEKPSASSALPWSSALNPGTSPS